MRNILATLGGIILILGIVVGVNILAAQRDHNIAECWKNTPKYMLERGQLLCPKEGK